MSKPTGLVRDSSLWIEYGPRDCGSCREAQTAMPNIRMQSGLRQRRISLLGEISVGYGGCPTIELGRQAFQATREFAERRDHQLIALLLRFQSTGAV